MRDRAWWWVVLLGAGCADDGLVKLLPKIEVDPEALDFGIGIVRQANPGALTIKNTGSGVLRLSGARIEGADARVFAIDPEPLAPPLTIAGRSQLETTLLFSPERAHEEYAGTLVLSSDDPDRPELAVPLSGVGGVREIEVVPAEIDFGVVDEGTDARRTVTIRNVGGDPLEVASVVLTSTSVDLRLAPDAFRGGRLLPGTSTTVTLSYSPIDLGRDLGRLEIASNDEDEPLVSVPVRALANLAPRAIAWGCPTEPNQIGCDGQPKLRRLTLGLRQRGGLDGRESFDPEGRGIQTFQFRVIERPMGSLAVPFHSSADLRDRKRATGDLEVDVTGAYDVRLIVKDERGLESFDTPESHVLVTPKDLEVVLLWDIGTDVDLHLVRPGGAIGDYGTGRAGTSTGSDCSTFNRAPNWSDPDTGLDDPHLDIDDVSGRGPEIVSLDGPETTGPYTVFVHYCDSRQIRVPVGAYVEVKIRGRTIARIPDGTGTFPLAPGELWAAGTVVWTAGDEPSAEVTTLASPPTMRPELCRN